MDSGTAAQDLIKLLAHGWGGVAAGGSLLVFAWIFYAFMARDERKTISAAADHLEGDPQALADQGKANASALADLEAKDAGRVQ